MINSRLLTLWGCQETNLSIAQIELPFFFFLIPPFSLTFISAIVVLRRINRAAS